MCRRGKWMQESLESPWEVREESDWHRLSPLYDLLCGRCCGPCPSACAPANVQARPGTPRMLTCCVQTAPISYAAVVCSLPAFWTVGEPMGKVAAPAGWGR